MGHFSGDTRASEISIPDGARGPGAGSLHNTYSFQFSGEVDEIDEFGRFVKAALEALRIDRQKATT